MSPSLKVGAPGPTSSAASAGVASARATERMEPSRRVPRIAMSGASFFRGVDAPGDAAPARGLDAPRRYPLRSTRGKREITGGRGPASTSLRGRELEPRVAERDGLRRHDGIELLGPRARAVGVRVIGGEVRG